MPEYMELDLAGAALRVQLADAGAHAPAGAHETGGTSGEDGAADPYDGADLPDGFGTATPVASGRTRAAALATGTLRATLRPLGPLLEEIHESVSANDHPPSELTVAFGVEIGQDLKLGIVGANGKATMTVSATWQLDARS
ncbi:CU044_2847 family protein [Streptomyces sp. NPDC050504]|uniref:CU044_2847 family protein n=1 Tax=Streptomyces sp. NPDC050504 TaxID=3365618 RepID=UPI0037AB5969